MPFTELDTFMNAFDHDESDFKFITNGLFGYVSYDAVQYFEDIKFAEKKYDVYKTPDIIYSVFRNIIVIDHFKNEMYIFDHQLVGQSSASNLTEIADLVKSKKLPGLRIQLEKTMKLPM